MSTKRADDDFVEQPKDLNFGTISADAADEFHHIDKFTNGTRARVYDTLLDPELLRVRL